MSTLKCKNKNDWESLYKCYKLKDCQACKNKLEKKSKAIIMEIFDGKNYGATWYYCPTEFRYRSDLMEAKSILEYKKINSPNLPENEL
jgi:hypothetical protein